MNNNSDDFTPRGETPEANETELKNETEAGFSSPDGDFAEPETAYAPAEEPLRAEPQQAPQWYGVSYQNGQPPVYAPYPAYEKPKKGKGKKIALIAAIVAACVLFSALAGFGGALLANGFNFSYGTASENGNANDRTPMTNTSPAGEGSVYRTSGTVYDYSTVEIPRKDESALADSSTGSAGESAKPLIEAVASVRDAVVEITATTTSSRGTISAGAGSGVIIHEDGIIVTNNHVISGHNEIYVRLTNGNTYEAVVRGTDEDGDVAVLKIDPTETLTVAKLGCSSALAVGESVFAIGNPLGELGGTVTSGIISAKEREVQVDSITMTLLQTDAAINAGNSGGGLFNLAGELIGVVNAKYSAAGVEGLGFAIPIDTAMISVTSLLQYGYIRGIPALGITVADGYERIPYSGWGYYANPVVYVAADSGQLKAEDIIRSIDGTAVTSTSALKPIIRRHAVGDVVTLVIDRNGEEKTVQITLVEYVPSGVNFGD